MQNWAIGVCVACIVAGVLEILLPERDSYKSIKMVLALYILLSIVSAPKAGDWSGLVKAMRSVDTSPQNYAGFVDTYSLSALATQLDTALLNDGVNGQTTVRQNGETVQVFVRTSQPSEAQKTIERELAGNTNIEIVVEETEDET